MKIAYALYVLQAAASALKREGAVLKITFDSGKVGFADCHVWPELGDLPLQEQLSCLAQGQCTSITRCALEFAALDAEYRSLGKSILIHQNIPRSHFLVTHVCDWTPQHVQQIIQQGYTHTKLKMGRHIDREVECLHSLFRSTALRLRLDFNETLQPQAFYHFLRRIETLKEQIDFIEDPFPFDAAEWTAIQKEGWTLACDRQAQAVCHQPEAAKMLIVKPAVHSFDEWSKWDPRRCIVTSYLGHPLGQMAAAYVAAWIDPSCACVHGLLSHHAYLPTPFSQHLKRHGPDFVFPPESGFGFDDALEQLEWTPLI